MDVRESVTSRFSCRAYLDKAVSESTVRRILSDASRAPSGGNLQPWRVYALTGGPLRALVTSITARAHELPRAEGAEYEIYPRDLKEPYKTRRYSVGEALYRSIEIDRTDKPGRYRQFARNFSFFGAPVGLFFSIDRTMGPPQWSDLGMYMQTVMLLAREHGLHTCSQEAWTIWHKTVSEFLDLPPEHILFCGMALGYGDSQAPINGWRSPREALDDFAAFSGFNS